MAYIDWKKLKVRVALPDLLAHYGLMDVLHATPQGYEGTCPFCGSSAFKVNTEKNVWFCFGECRGTGEKGGGNILDFVARKDRVSLKEAANRIAGWFPEDGRAMPTTHKPADTGSSPEEGLQEVEGQGDGETLPGAVHAPGEPLRGSVFPDVPNKPLTFTLKGISASHEFVTAAGISAAVAQSYGAGYFTGKGSMHNHLVFPFHDELGQTLAYAGYNPSNGTWKYPAGDKFNPTRAVFGLYHALTTDEQRDMLVVCRTPLAALRYRSDHRTVSPIAITTDTISAHHMALLADLMEGRDKVLLVAPPDDLHVAEFLSVLLARWFVRLER
jgi:hypothetical protein